MANFLNLLSAAFKLTHTQSVPKPNSNAVNIQISSGVNYTFTAPSAGYVCSYYVGALDTGEAFLGHSPSPQSQSTTAVTSICRAANGGWLGGWIRVRKGDQVAIWVNYNPGTGHTWFVPDEGA